MTGSEPWAPGDLALCVRDGDPRFREWCDPLSGSINAVEAVVQGFHLVTGEPGIGLIFVGIRPELAGSYDPGRFRRIPPPTIEERRQAEEEARDLVPAVVPA